MKRTLWATAILSLIMTCTTAGLGQAKTKARVKPPTKGGQICTGCCDPCYSDDGWHVRQPQNNSAKATKPAGKTRNGHR